MSEQRKRCDVCRNFHVESSEPCPSYRELYEALFGSGAVELSEREKRVLGWLAGVTDIDSRSALLSIIKKARER